MDYFKRTFSDRSIVVLSEGAEPPEGTLALRFCDKTACTAEQLADTLVSANFDAIDIAKLKHLVVSRTSPVRLYIQEPGEPLPRNCRPLASWDGKVLHIATPHDVEDKILHDVLVSGIPPLISIPAMPQDYTALAKTMSFDLAKDREKFIKQAASNREKAELKAKEAVEFESAAIRDEIIADNLKAMEEGEVNKVAQQQWRDLLEMIPKTLQKISVEDNCLIATTQPIILMATYMGSYKISIPLKTAGDSGIKISHLNTALDRSGCCHPHIKASGGTICWGNLANKVREGLSKKNFFDIISLALRLLNSYREEDKYAQLDNWGDYAGRPEDGSGCQRKGPSYSYDQVKKCVRCMEKGCVSKVDRFKACMALSDPFECVSCTLEKCSFRTDATNRCFELRKVAGPAACMLRCTNECSHLDEASSLCSSVNLSGDTCPAADKCRKPCRPGKDSK